MNEVLHLRTIDKNGGKVISYPFECFERRERCVIVSVTDI